MIAAWASHFWPKEFVLEGNPAAAATDVGTRHLFDAQNVSKPSPLCKFLISFNHITTDTHVTTIRRVVCFVEHSHSKLSCPAQNQTNIAGMKSDTADPRHSFMSFVLLYTSLWHVNAKNGASYFGFSHNLCLKESIVTQPNKSNMYSK